MRYWETLDTIERDGFEIVLDMTPEDMSLEDAFDDSIDPDTGKPFFDIKDMYRQIEQGNMAWFMLRARAFFEGHEFGDSCLGGLLYDVDKINDVWSDGIAEDLIHWALQQGREELARIKSRLAEMEV